jgi:hypothetical protein
MPITTKKGLEMSHEIPVAAKPSGPSSTLITRHGSVHTESPKSAAAGKENNSEALAKLRTIKKFERLQLVEFSARQHQGVGGACGSEGEEA